ncbi:MAG: hypothetical protein US40_C0001G0001 [Candidatus Roizmanbacteria bacterium GW2011_GWC2_37_13]|uniref:Uncharacterized protein n=1 Tax=Candidatus Roizmanbacteria bacterium GW2011_GWC2_37_13 TaxID=1618486 RepID=A0A0G0G9K6_9BACT|nr:MAG: hypothetical protein US38_C0002G0001 [Candidatus Roizmanbacteria bacterium GW2011_GWC1_37_12]KKQ26652.1 MAG: hypothetical protein US40_C0001G0001 [Candidatus Roizmanbacteria bacterium GW2011_GWC2_37_13]
MRILKLVNPTRKDAFDAARDGRYIYGWKIAQMLRAINRISNETLGAIKEGLVRIEQYRQRNRNSRFKA